MRQCRFILGKTCTVSVKDVDNWEVCACAGAGSIWEIFVPSSQFCCKLETALRKKSLKVKIRNYESKYMLRGDHSLGVK